MNSRPSTFRQRHVLAMLTLAALATPVQADRSDAIEQRLNQLERQAERQLDDIRALRKEVEAALASNASDSAEDQPSQHTHQRSNEAEKYHALIRERLAQAWCPPASTRQGHSTTIKISQLPTGERTSVALIEPSGSKAFDDSVLSTARSLSRYPIPDDRNTFEQHFRSFTIKFSPTRLR